MQKNVEFPGRKFPNFQSSTLFGEDIPSPHTTSSTSSSSRRRILLTKS